MRPRVMMGVARRESLSMRSPFGRVPEQVAADLGAVRDDGGVVEQRLVSDLHLEEPFVSRGQLLGRGSQTQQQQQQRQRRAPRFTLPHSERHGKHDASVSLLHHSYVLKGNELLSFPAESETRRWIPIMCRRRETTGSR